MKNPGGDRSSLGHNISTHCYVGHMSVGGIYQEHSPAQVKALVGLLKVTSCLVPLSSLLEHSAVHPAFPSRTVCQKSHCALFSHEEIMFVRAGVRQDERPSAALSIQPDSGKLYLVRERERVRTMQG